MWTLSWWRSQIEAVFPPYCERHGQLGIAVVTWDSDADPDARDYFLNQATPEGIAKTLTDEAERLLPGGGPVCDYHWSIERGKPE